MRGDVILSGLILLGVAVIVLFGGAALGILIIGIYLAGIFGFFGVVVTILGLFMVEPVRTCYICGITLTSPSDYRRHFEAVHPGQNP